MADDHPEDRRADQALRRRACAGGRQLRAAHGRACRDRGRQRRRQVDLRAPDHRRRAADRAARSGSTARRSTSPARSRRARPASRRCSRTSRWPTTSTCRRTCSSAARRSCFNLGPFSILDRKGDARGDRCRRWSSTGGEDPQPRQHHPQHVGRPAPVRGDRADGDLRLEAHHHGRADGGARACRRRRRSRTSSAR